MLTYYQASHICWFVWQGRCCLRGDIEAGNHYPCGCDWLARTEKERRSLAYPNHEDARHQDLLQQSTAFNRVSTLILPRSIDISISCVREFSNIVQHLHNS